MSDPVPYTVERANKAVTIVRIPIGSITAWEQWFLLSSDHHWDNPDCNLETLKRHMEQAVERQAGVMAFGDIFCAMQGKYDKRSSKSKVRPEHQNGEYLDSLVSTAAEWYGRYASSLLLLTEGNHETAIKGRHETCLITRLCERINTQQGSSVLAGGYGGWVKFAFQRCNEQVSRNLKYFHGAGGGGPVTRGVIQTNRQAVYLPDAHFVVNGHTHDDWLVTISRERLNQHSQVTMDEQVHVRCPSYKDEYRDGTGGWHVETWKPPKPIGAWWLRFYWDGKRGLTHEFTQAR